MSRSLNITGEIFDKSRIYRKAAFMGMSAIMASGAIITFYNTQLLSYFSAETAAGLELAAVTLMPYMISAVIATITAIGVMNFLPTTRVVAPAEQIVHRLRELSDGDLTSRVRLESDDPLKEVGIAYNAAAEHLGGRIAAWKVVNRQQWGVLGRIRQAVEENDMPTALRFVAEMEQNWDRIAEIEQQLEC